MEGLKENISYHLLHASGYRCNAKSKRQNPTSLWSKFNVPVEYSKPICYLPARIPDKLMTGAYLRKMETNLFIVKAMVM